MVLKETGAYEWLPRPRVLARVVVLPRGANGLLVCPRGAAPPRFPPRFVVVPRAKSVCAGRSVVVSVLVPLPLPLPRGPRPRAKGLAPRAPRPRSPPRPPRGVDMFGAGVERRGHAPAWVLCAQKKEVGVWYPAATRGCGGQTVPMGTSTAVAVDATKSSKSRSSMNNVALATASRAPLRACDHRCLDLTSELSLHHNARTEHSPT